VFALLFAMNMGVTIKYKIYGNSSSLFIVVSLMLLDILRVSSFIGAFFFTTYFFNSELLIRLGHDVPSFMFDCVTIALLFQFIQTYDVLSNHERAFVNLQKRVYITIEYVFVAVYVCFMIMDIVSLCIDASQHFTGSNKLSSISELLLCIMVTVIWLMYIVLFLKFLILFRRSEGAFDHIRKQVMTFFFAVIALLLFRLILHWLFFVNDYNNQIASLYRNHESVKLFWIHIGQLIIVIVEAVFNGIVLYNLVDNVKNQERIEIKKSIARETERLTIRASLRGSIKGPLSPGPLSPQLKGSLLNQSGVVDQIQEIDQQYADLIEEEVDEEDLISEDQGTIEEDVSMMEKTGSVATEGAFKTLEKKKAVDKKQHLVGKAQDFSMD